MAVSACGDPFRRISDKALGGASHGTEKTPEPPFSIRVTCTKSARRSGSISTPRSALTSSCTRRWLAEQAFYLRPEPLRHPLIFYLGHTAVFYINKLIVARITNQQDQSAVRVDVRGRCRRDVLGRSERGTLRLADAGRGQGVSRHGACGGGRYDQDHAPDDAHQLGPSVLGDSDGHRTPENPSGDVLGHHSPASDRDGPTAPAVEHLPRNGRGAVERTDTGRRRPRRSGQIQGPPALWLGQRIRPPGKRRLGLLGQPLPGFEPGVPEFRRRPRL